jgi:hypothetical protein
MEAAIVAQMGLTQHKAALSMLKQSADMQQQMANILLEAVEAIPEGTRGHNVNLRV